MSASGVVPVLEVEGLRKAFRSSRGGTRLVLDIPHFALESGEHAALRGPSGCGKSTLLHLISGILLPDAGRIRVAGIDIATLPEASRDRVRALHVGVVFQSFNLLQGYSALENVEMAMRFGRGADRAEARSLLGRVGLTDRLEDRPRQLSAGQQQRVALARALANRPELVLADEPTAHLDPALAREAMVLLREVCAESGSALLLVSHDAEALSGFSRLEEFSSVNRVPAGGASPDQEPRS